MTKLTTWGVRAMGIAALGAAAGLTKAARGIPRAMGGTPQGDLAARVAASPHFRDGKFHNEEMTWLPGTRSMGESLAKFVTPDAARTPKGAVPLVTEVPEPATEGLHLTWYGHSNVLIEIDGGTVLIDPVWSDRVSPSQQMGPKRLHPNPIALADLPPIDAVIISHDHYDHLDMDTIRELAKTTEAQFLVPLGVGAHLMAWGVAAERIEDLDWDEDAKMGDLKFTATQAQHFSGRGFSRDGTQWASWVIEGPEHKVFYSGDGGYFVGFGLIGQRHGPFDVALVQVGAYDDGWPTIHMTPEQGVETVVDVQADLLVPVHWATFNLAFHPWAEPIERLLTAAEKSEVSVAVPRPGQRIEVSAPPALDPWWRALT